MTKGFSIGLTLLAVAGGCEPCGDERQSRIEHVSIIKVVEPTHVDEFARFDPARMTLSKPYTVVQTKHSYTGNVSPGQRYIVPGVWGEPGDEFDMRVNGRSTVTGE